MPDWETNYTFAIIVLVLFAIFTGHLEKPWGPFLTISESELRFNRIPFFLHFSFLDRFLWKTFPIQSIASMQLVIRADDKNKAGFKLEGNQDDVDKFFKNFSYDDYISWRRTKGFSGNMPYYKNQKLALLDKNSTTIAELTVSFAYEEDLNKLQTYMNERHIPFTITFRFMNDELRDLYN